MHGQQLNGTSR